MTNADICVSRLSNQSRDRSRLNSVAFTNIPATVFATVSRTRNDLPRAYSLPGLISGTIRVAQSRELSDPTEPRGSCVSEGSFNDGPSSLRPSPNNKQSDRNGELKTDCTRNDVEEPQRKTDGDLLRDGARLCKPLLFAWCTVSDARSTTVTRLWPKKGPVVFGGEIYEGCMFRRKNSAHLSLLP